MASTNTSGRSPTAIQEFSIKAAAQQWASITTYQLLDDPAAPPASRHTLTSILEQYLEKSSV